MEKGGPASGGRGTDMSHKAAPSIWHLLSNDNPKRNHRGTGVQGWESEKRGNKRSGAQDWAVDFSRPHRAVEDGKMASFVPQWRSSIQVKPRSPCSSYQVLSRHMWLKDGFEAWPLYSLTEQLQALYLVRATLGCSRVYIALKDKLPQGLVQVSIKGQSHN